MQWQFTFYAINYLWVCVHFSVLSPEVITIRQTDMHIWNVFHCITKAAFGILNSFTKRRTLRLSLYDLIGILEFIREFRETSWVTQWPAAQGYSWEIRHPWVIFMWAFLVLTCQPQSASTSLSQPLSIACFCCRVQAAPRERDSCLSGAI